LYQQFCEILSIHGSRTLNPSNFLDYLSSLITIYIGKNQTVSISKYSSNNHINNHPLSITNIDMLIPYHAPRDKVSFTIPQSIKNKMKKALQIEQEKKNEYMSWDTSENQIDIISTPKNNDNHKQVENVNDKYSINASYAFGALPDQRLFADNKCSPYVMDETFRWTILYGTTVKPPKFRGKANCFEKITAAAIISDGENITYCIYGTRNGLFYNKNERQKPVKIINKMVNGIWRQNDNLFVLCQGPILYNISLTTKSAEIAINEVFRTKKSYNVYTVFNSFIGGYYDSEKDELILATHNAQIYIFKNGGKIDHKFNDRFNAFRRKQLSSQQTDQKLEKGNLMYYDVDRNCIVYIGTKYVIKVSLDKVNIYGDYSIFDDKFVKIYDVKWFLKGISYDCNYFMYIYHQKTMAILKRVQSSAHCPYVLKIYTGKSLQFK